MPYIHPEDRALIDNSGFSVVDTPGELNYYITTTCLKYLGQNKGYTIYNEIIGVLECVKLELYRRVVAPYEDIKKEQNGDVYN